MPLKYWDDEDNVAEGFNLIGIYPGSNFGSSEDRILVVGAHWDTTGFTDGLNDNGSGNDESLASYTYIL